MLSPVPHKPRVRRKAYGYQSGDLTAASRATMQAMLHSQDSYYDGASRTSPEMGSWQAGPASPDRAMQYEADVIGARVWDLIRNNGYAAGAARRYKDSVVGFNMRPIAEPDGRRLGLSDIEIGLVAEQMEAAFQEWSDNPGLTADVSRVQTGGGLIGQAFHELICGGDCLALLLARQTESPYQTAMQMLDPARLSNPDNQPDRGYMRRGIELNADGAAVAYHIRRAHPDDLWLDQLSDRMRWDRWPREIHGRPVVLHAFEKTRPGQTRGISRFAPILTGFKMFSGYSSAELQAAVINAVMAMSLESAFDPSLIMETLDDGDLAAESFQDFRSEFYAQNPVRFNGAKVPILSPGDKINWSQPVRPNTAFASFAASILAAMATGFGGMSYEQFSNDWSRSNYSSARGGMLEAWRTVMSDRQMFVSQFVNRIYYTVIREAVMMGKVRLPDHAPGFLEAPAAWCRARWIGPARGYLDPAKEVAAMEGKIRAKVSTHLDEAIEQGRDPDAILIQQVRERRKFAEAGIPYPGDNPAPVAAPSEPEPEEEQRPVGPDQNAPEEQGAA